MNNKTGNLFANRSSFDYGFDGRVLWIKDLGGAKSVTNDIENILNDVIEQNSFADVKAKQVMYLDSQGIWDGVRMTFEKNRVTGVDFFSINEKEQSKAKAKLLEISNKQKVGQSPKL